MSNPFREKGYFVQEIRNHAYDILDQPIRYQITRQDTGEVLFEGTWRDCTDWIAGAENIQPG
ncbi:hypothetical protein ESD82_13565 [Paracoccus pantotrophus]|uniref:Uncharacterized protein n=1 Tax=Paracoccus pantotrophus TaxID=82367 RepID=A0AAE6NY56_PARPN|nr:hypothetical protein [Paracoccus pantotrophus]QFG37202.1 hypothetical protein ESD82_13565 [Paracoccus pantotrophus]